MNGGRDYFKAAVEDAAMAIWDDPMFHTTPSHTRGIRSSSMAVGLARASPRPSFPFASRGNFQ